MQMTRLIPVGIALVAAVAAGFIAMNFVSQPPVVEQPVVASPQTQKEPTVRVLVAATDINMGGRINSANVRWDDWPEKLALTNSDFITDAGNPNALSEFNNYIAMSSVFSGEPITEKKFVKADQGFMSALLPAGKRAIATEISLVSGAGGFILPNDRVDVIMVRSLSNQDNAPVVTETLLENIRVLAIGQTIREEKGEAVVEGKTATLELTPEQVRIVTAAREVAISLTLALRSLSDSGEEVKTNGRSLVNNNDDDETRSGSVRMIQGGAISTAVAN